MKETYDVHSQEERKPWQEIKKKRFGETAMTGSFSSTGLYKP
jgi:hypothetical protein